MYWDITQDKEQCEMPSLAQKRRCTDQVELQERRRVIEDYANSVGQFLNSLRKLMN